MNPVQTTQAGRRWHPFAVLPDDRAEQANGPDNRLWLAGTAGLDYPDAVEAANIALRRLGERCLSAGLTEVRNG